MHVAVALLRVSDGLDHSAIMEETDESKKLITTTIRGNQSFSQLSQGNRLIENWKSWNYKTRMNMFTFFYFLDFL